MNRSWSLPVFIIVSACRAPGSDNVSGPPGAASASLSSPKALPSVGAAAPKGAVGDPPSGKTIDASGEILDTPPWPAEPGPDMKLTWAVYPRVGQGETSTRNVEVVARIGETARRFKLGPVRGAFQSQDQSFCGAKVASDQLSKVVFVRGGTTTFVAKREAPGMLVIERVSAADGYCPTHDCDTHKTLVKIPIPETVRIVESISDVQGPGREAPLDCTGTGSQASCKPGEVGAFESETSKPICAKPCGGAAKCDANEECKMAYKSLTPTMGMAQARANEVYVCRPIAPPSKR